jgi:signal peptidase I
MDATAQSRDSLKLELAAEILREFAEVRFVARGSSMIPAIYPGDCLKATAYGDDSPQCGEIVLCRLADGVRVHRIVRIFGEGHGTRYLLRGDALMDEDAPVQGEGMLGRVTLIERRGRPFAVEATMAVWQRALRMVVRQSKLAAALLLSWHARQERHFHLDEPLLEGPGRTNAEYT